MCFKAEPGQTVRLISTNDPFENFGMIPESRIKSQSRDLLL